ncbi:MAG: hypothetical protein ACOY3P_07230 [Planctomycetota bacterium]
MIEQSESDVQCALHLLSGASRWLSVLARSAGADLPDAALPDACRQLQRAALALERAVRLPSGALVSLTPALDAQAFAARQLADAIALHARVIEHWSEAALRKGEARHGCKTG